MAQHRRMEVKFYEAAGLKNVRTFAGISAHLDDDLDMHLVLGVAVLKGGKDVASGGIEHNIRNYSKAKGCNWEGEGVAFECPASYFGQQDFQFLVLIYHRSEYLDELSEVGRVLAHVPATTTEPSTLTASDYYANLQVLTKKGKPAGTLTLAVTVGPEVMRLQAVEAAAPAATKEQRKSSGFRRSVAVQTISQLLASAIESDLS